MPRRAYAGGDRTDPGDSAEPVRRPERRVREAVAENHQLRLVEIGDAAGDDQADSGSKTAERDAATSLLRTLLDRRTQAEHAMARLEDGTYGNCEGCHNPIPVERLEVFPSATTCVNCKQNRERRAG